MAHRFKIGDTVTWNSEAGLVSGTIIKIHSKDFNFKGYTIMQVKTILNTKSKAIKPAILQHTKDLRLRKFHKSFLFHWC
jgi:hypothetical protein